MTTTPDVPNTSAQQAEREFHAESIRLAELRLQQIRDSIHTIEKKAVILISGCVALMGSLLLGFGADFANAGLIGEYVCMECLVYGLRLAAFAFLVLAMLKGENAVNVATVRFAGLPPKSSEKFYQYSNSHSWSAERDKRLLALYQERIDAMHTVQQKKAAKLKLARFWLMWGVMAAMLRLAAIFYVL